MRTVLWIVGAMIGLFILLWMNAILATIRLDRRLRRRLEPAIRAVQNGDEAATELVLALARDPTTRISLFATLVDMGRTEVFPEEYRTNSREE
jgi:hypothetical protein